MLLSVLAIFWVCLLRQGKQKQTNGNNQTKKLVHKKTRTKEKAAYWMKIYANNYLTKCSHTKYIKIHLTQRQKKNSYHEMDREPKQTFLQKRHTNGQQVYEKMLIITHQQGNANQNHNEDFSVGPVVKNLLANAGDTSSILFPEKSTCRRTAKPMCHNYWVCVRQLLKAHSP